MKSDVKLALRLLPIRAPYNSPKKIIIVIKVLRKEYHLMKHIILHKSEN